MAVCTTQHHSRVGMHAAVVFGSRCIGFAQACVARFTASRLFHRLGYGLADRGIWRSDCFGFCGGG